MLGLAPIIRRGHCSRWPDACAPCRGMVDTGFRQRSSMPRQWRCWALWLGSLARTQSHGSRFLNLADTSLNEFRCVGGMASADGRNHREPPSCTVRSRHVSAQAFVAASAAQAVTAKERALGTARQSSPVIPARLPSPAVAQLHGLPPWSAHQKSCLDVAALGRDAGKETVQGADIHQHCAS